VYKDVGGACCSLICSSFFLYSSCHCTDHYIQSINRSIQTQTRIESLSTQIPNRVRRQRTISLHYLPTPSIAYQQQDQAATRQINTKNLDDTSAKSQHQTPTLPSLQTPTNHSNDYGSPQVRHEIRRPRLRRSIDWEGRRCARRK
jgi:hypothetical protein